MREVHNLAIHVSRDAAGYGVEVRAYGPRAAAPLVVEYYQALTRDELEQVVGATLDDLRPGTGVFTDGPGRQERLPALD